MFKIFILTGRHEEYFFLNWVYNSYVCVFTLRSLWILNEKLNFDVMYVFLVATFPEALSLLRTGLIWVHISRCSALSHIVRLPNLHSTSAQYTALDHFLSHHSRMGNNSFFKFYFSTSNISPASSCLEAFSSNKKPVHAKLWPFWHLVIFKWK